MSEEENVMFDTTKLPEKLELTNEQLKRVEEIGMEVTRILEKPPRCMKCRVRNVTLVDVDKILFIKCNVCGHELKAERKVRE
jgi:transcription elongation factor Elf1